MNFIDIILIIFTGIGFVLGFKDGFVRKIIGLVGFIGAVLAAFLFSDELGRAIESVTGIEYYLSSLIAGAAIFILVMLMFSILKRVVHPFDKVNNLLNQFVGGVVGVVQVLFFASAALLILNIFNVPGKSERNNSVLYGKVHNIIPFTIDYLKDYAPDTKEIIKEYIYERDTLR